MTDHSNKPKIEAPMKKAMNPRKPTTLEKSKATESTTSDENTATYAKALQNKGGKP